MLVELIYCFIIYSSNLQVPFLSLCLKLWLEAHHFNGVFSTGALYKVSETMDLGNIVKQMIHIYIHDIQLHN